MSNTKVFNPVKIEIEFCNREQLAAFIAIMGNPSTVANSVAGASVDVNARSHRGNSMNYRDMYNAINSLIEIKELEELIKLVDA